MTRILTVVSVVGACAIALAATPTSANFRQRWEPEEIWLERLPKQATCLLDFTTEGIGPYRVTAWSLAFCIDKAKVKVDSAELGADASICKAGRSPDFAKIIILDDGVACGVLVDFEGVEKVMAPRIGFKALRVTFSNMGLGIVDRTQASSCATLGSPQVIPVVVADDGSFPFGEALPLSIRAIHGDPCFCVELWIEPAGACGAAVLMRSETWSVDAVSFGVAHTGDAITATVERGAAIMNADFFGVRIVPGGVTIAIVISLDEPFTPLPPSQDPIEIARARYESLSASQVEVWLTDLLGSPPVDIVIDSGGMSLPRDRIEVDTRQVAVFGHCDTFEFFVRGDANQDREINISDAVFIARILFGLIPDPGCKDAMDTNDDGVLDPADSIFLLRYLFLDGAALRPPIAANLRAVVRADCGLDPTNDGLRCPDYRPCRL